MRTPRSIRILAKESRSPLDGDGERREIPTDITPHRTALPDSRRVSHGGDDECHT
jgi:hypothetical protein